MALCWTMQGELHTYMYREGLYAIFAATCLSSRLAGCHGAVCNKLIVAADPARPLTQALLHFPSLSGDF